MKKIISMLLALAMLFSITAVSFAADINFSDVTEDDWFYDDIKTVVEMGLINGKSNDRYAPNDNLTYAEAIKLAACMNQFYTAGAVTLANGNPWYQPYVDYCIAQGIIGDAYNYEENATRAGYMTIFANALPDEALQEINSVPDDAIPDVPATKGYATAVYKLYRAGILTGVDDKHNCEPLVNISRKEVAAIVARMMNETKRAHFTIVSVDSVQTNDTEQDENSDYIINESKNYDVFGFNPAPSDVSVDCGTTATFHTEGVGGHKPYTYRWQCLNEDSWIDLEDTDDDDIMIIGATETSLYIQTYVPGTTELRCVITDSDGESITTRSATLTAKAVNWSYVTDWKVNTGDTTDNDDSVEDSTVISDSKVNTGDTTDDNDRVEDSTVVSDWKVNTGDTTDDSDSVEDSTVISDSKVDIDDKTDNGNDDSTDDGLYYVENATVIYPNASAELKIETQPNDAGVAVNQTAKFAVEVSGGTTPYSYQWQNLIGVDRRTKWQNLTNIKDVCSGANSKTLSLTSPTEGTVLLRCVVTDADGNKVTTVSVKLTVTEQKSILPSRRNLS